MDSNYDEMPNNQATVPPKSIYPLWRTNLILAEVFCHKFTTVGWICQFCPTKHDSKPAAVYRNEETIEANFSC